jgi:alpha-galactosidase
MTLDRLPDRVLIQNDAENGPHVASSGTGDNGSRCWDLSGTRVTIKRDNAGGMPVHVESPRIAVSRVVLRWSHPTTLDALILGDAWERSYGELHWASPASHRPLPWYFLLRIDESTFGFGVETGAASIACWWIDHEGIRLELDVRCGGNGVQLGQRSLHAATLVMGFTIPRGTSFGVAQEFCRRLCPSPLMPAGPVIGHNDWYWLYGKSSEALILEATVRMVDLCSGIEGAPQPWSIIDDGWQDSNPLSEPLCHGGPWERGNSNFPDMPGLAKSISDAGARPGIWIRPLFTHAQTQASWILKAPSPISHTSGFRLDPSVPEVLHQVASDTARLREWGFQLIKHDFTTFDVSGRWGFEMNTYEDRFTSAGWSFSDTSKTSAEIITVLYRTIREAAGSDCLIIGCNTIGHLAAGLVEIQRTGDDTSAVDWDRTRRMGINTLAFRSPQHGAFFAVDADCVPISPHVPWNLTNSWLELVAKSGTPFFLSIDPAAFTSDHKVQIRDAVAAASRRLPIAEPVDWMETPLPNRWLLEGRNADFCWNEVQ